MRSLCHTDGAWASIRWTLQAGDAVHDLGERQQEQQQLYERITSGQLASSSDVLPRAAGQLVSSAALAAGAGSGSRGLGAAAGHAAAPGAGRRPTGRSLAATQTCQSIQWAASFQELQAAIDGSDGPLDPAQISALLSSLARLTQRGTATPAAGGGAAAAAPPSPPDAPVDGAADRQQSTRPPAPGVPAASARRRGQAGDPSLQQRLLARAVLLVRQHSSTLGPRHCSSILHALAKLGLEDQRLVNELLRRARAQASGFTPQGLSTVLYAAALLGSSVSSTWQATWLAACGAAMQQFGPQDLAMTAWGLGWLGVQPSSAWTQAFLQQCEVGARGVPTPPQTRARSLLPIPSAPHLGRMVHSLSCDAPAPYPFSATHPAADVAELAVDPPPPSPRSHPPAHCRPA